MNIKKKGFTIVELVIVIAVVAILAAVLIPTFASLVKKANMSADQQAVRQMNTILVAENVENEIEGVEEVRDILLKNGFDVESYTPMAEGTRFYWVQSIKRVIYVNEEDKTVIYPLGLETGSSDLWEPLDVEEEILTGDLAVAQFLNEILSNILSEGKTIEDLASLYAHFANEGYNIEGYTPLDSDYAFYWIKDNDVIVLADKETKTVIYPTNSNTEYADSSTWKMLGKLIDENTPTKEDGRIDNEEVKGVIVIDRVPNPDPATVEGTFVGGNNWESHAWDNGAFYKFSLPTDEEAIKKMEDYIDWIPDYAIILNNDLEANSGGIVGYLEEWNLWNAIVSDTDLEAGFSFLLLRDLLAPDAALTYTYEDIEMVNPFTCGAFSLDESNSGKSITVQLRLYDPDTIDDEVQQYIVLTEILCVFE